MSEATAQAPPTTDAPATHLERVYRQTTSLCIKCGFCLPVCPTYRETGVESASPRGRLDLMYAVARGELAVQEVQQQLDLCLGCLACQTACPSAIAYGEMFEAAQSDIGDATRRQTGGRLRRLLLRRVVESPHVLRTVVWGLYLYQRSGLQHLVRATRLLRLFGRRLETLERRAPPLQRPRDWRAPGAEYASAVTGYERTTGRPSRPVALFTGCIMDAAFGEVHEATLRVLAHNGRVAHIPARGQCCGALHAHAGEREEARRLARQTIAAFESVPDVPVLVNAAGCGALLKDYGALLADDPEWAGRAERFAARVQDISVYLAGLELLPPLRPVNRRVAYDDPCHLVHAQRVSEPPRALLRQIPGLKLAPLAEADWCCGSAGSYSLVHPDMSRRVLHRKMANVQASGAQVVASGNPGCILQLRLGARDAGLDVRVAHPVELLAESYG